MRKKNGHGTLSESFTRIGKSPESRRVVPYRGKGRVSIRELGESPNRSLRMQVVGARPGEGSPDAGTGGAGSPLHEDTEIAFGFLPKRMLITVAYDEEVTRIVQGIVNANQTSRHGDGRIFICPVISAMRVRTGEQRDKALP